MGLSVSPENRKERGRDDEEASELKENLVVRAEMSELAESNEPGSPPTAPRFSKIAFWVVGLAAVLTTAAIIYTCLQVKGLSVSTSGDMERAFFIFGDSYADVGNIPGGQAWNSPYGTTWPGQPAGRFSDGHVLSDYLATQVLGIKSPPAFAESNIKTLSQGVNFAVGGAAVTYAYGAPTISTQVSWFESIVKSRIYTKDSLASSVTLLCVAGNDYGAFQGPLENYISFTEEVVGLIEESLRKLYSLGLRNILVTTLAPLACLPEETIFTNFTACSSNATVIDVEVRHNSLLQSTLMALSKNLVGTNFVLLRQGDALKQIQANMTSFNINEPIKPCCLGFCGVVDKRGNLLYTLCDNPENHVVWDGVHPTQAAWENVVKLFLNDETYTTFVPTLRHWTQELP